MNINTALHRVPIIRQFGKFGIVGASSTIIDFGVFNLLNAHILLPVWLAHACSFSISVCNSYYWNSRWTFKGRRTRNAVHEFHLFLLISLVGLLLSEAIILNALRFLPAPHTLLQKNGAKVLATVFVMFWNFLANRRWTFPKQTKHTVADTKK